MSNFLSYFMSNPSLHAWLIQGTSFNSMQVAVFKTSTKSFRWSFSKFQKPCFKSKGKKRKLSLNTEKSFALLFSLSLPLACLENENEMDWPNIICWTAPVLILAAFYCWETRRRGKLAAFKNVIWLVVQVSKSTPTQIKSKANKSYLSHAVQTANLQLFKAELRFSVKWQLKFYLSLKLPDSLHCQSSWLWAIAVSFLNAEFPPQHSSGILLNSLSEESSLPLWSV